MIYKNPLAVYATPNEKITKYTESCHAGAMAHCSDGQTVRLTDVSPEHVEFIGGLWRVQNDCDYKISTIRKRMMILGPRIPHNEKTFFEYYRAAFVGFNCYGPIINAFDMIVAKYTTDHGTYWAYGRTIADARAYLGIKLYDQYMNLIHSVACKNARGNSGK